jgi:hypothetical protein
MNTQKVNSVTASKFLNWYFSDSDLVEDFGRECVNMIETFGIVNISARQLFEGCGYIPQSICEDWADDWDNEQEYSPEEIEFINDIDSH